MKDWKQIRLLTDSFMGANVNPLSVNSKKDNIAYVIKQIQDLGVATADEINLTGHIYLSFLNWFQSNLWLKTQKFNVSDLEQDKEEAVCEILWKLLKLEKKSSSKQSKSEKKQFRHTRVCKKKKK